MLFYYKGNNSKMGDNSEKKQKKHGSPIFSWGIHIWNLKTLTYVVLNLCYVYESNKWPKIAKSHNSYKISLNWLKTESGDCLLSPNQYTKYQDSSSNTFWDILPTRFQCFFIKRAITLKWEIIWIRKKYAWPIISWGIHIWNFKTLAYMVLNLCYAHESNKIK